MKVWCDVPGKIVLIGQAPSKETDGGVPFSGRSGRRIADLMGIRQAELGVRFALANVLDAWPGPSRFGKGDAFPLDAARLEVARLRRKLVGRRLVVFGASVAKVFGYDPREILLRFLSSDSGAIAYVPHPSGVNTWWNESANVAQAQRFLQSLLLG